MTKFWQSDYFFSSDTIDDGDGLAVAMLYPIHDIIPSIPPTAMSTESCKTMGLHSESIKRYAYTKNAPMHETKIMIPTLRCLVIELKSFCELFILI